jgi:hypothetical protein
MRSLFVRLRDAIRRFWKWCRSFAKTDWELQDYPISIKRQKLDLNLPARFRKFTEWTSQISSPAGFGRFLIESNELSPAIGPDKEPRHS